MWDKARRLMNPVRFHAGHYTPCEKPARHLPAMLRPSAIGKPKACRVGNVSFRILPRSRDGAEVGSRRGLSELSSP